ncbi:uncharacterized protein [Chelonus insularis]|uniref:uncharacterized protein n=1 Tax=Chelonus insularis TaxID=460826 RepID=UPI00158AAF55|nr:uncharacterized protein LOC118071577 [Chelonus insularis]
MSMIRRLAILSAIKSLQSNGTVSEESDPCPSGYNMSSNYNGNVGIFGASIHSNVLIQGAVLMGAIITAVLVCYCCLRNSSKNRQQQCSEYTIAEPDVQSLQVFTTNSYTDREFEEHRYDDWLDRSNEDTTPVSLRTCPGTPGPPPAYESLIFVPPSLPSPSQKEESTINENTICSLEKLEKKDEGIDDGLPPYEAAIKLAADGYV